LKFKKDLIYILVSLGVILLALCIGIPLIFKDANTAIRISNKDSTTFVHQIPGDYKQVFEAFKGYKNLSFEGSYYSKTRNPISIFKYKDDYNILLYKMPTENKQPLSKIIKEEFTSSGATSGIYYRELFSDQFRDKNYLYNIQYKCGNPETAKEIYLTLSGNNTYIFKKNDTIAIYNSELNNFSIRYSQDGNKDFYGEVKNDSLAYKLPIQITFLKHNNYIYLSIATRGKPPIDTAN
jgi:hypothetical protein